MKKGFAILGTVLISTILHAQTPKTQDSSAGQATFINATECVYDPMNHSYSIGKPHALDFYSQVSPSAVQTGTIPAPQKVGAFARMTQENILYNPSSYSRNWQYYTIINLSDNPVDNADDVQAKPGGSYFVIVDAPYNDIDTVDASNSQSVAILMSQCLQKNTSN
ncbi:MAG: hypothetical protein COV52_03765 [Gammaproteobacteria bacterium CG11_big_fil_rev_8_21_14_0_20_46_22]|nr:MAG: hypothetical protein COW05_04950 [Gammaproteobacteria bacterium CG12_big_fil_rev_8_21_14_0_65_46_12]PIR11437.1 MAG: hypothetical protein COV52_03765 [Gammaproteobacteria bacterium CG11_big_fil_rev_8_21_14_0_20_46_22]